MNTVYLISDAEQATLDFVLVSPLLVLLLVHFLSETIIVPLALALATFMVSKMLLGPLVLIFAIYFARLSSLLSRHIISEEQLITTHKLMNMKGDRR